MIRGGQIEFPITQFDCSLNTPELSYNEISDDRFKCVYEFKTARSTMQGGCAGKRTEKLFMVLVKLNETAKTNHC